MEARKHAKKSKHIEQQTKDAYLHALPNEVLYSEIRPHLSPKNQFALTRVCANFNALFQPDLNKIALLQAVLDGNKAIVKMILDAKPELLLDESRNLVIESQYTWQKFHANKPLKLAIMKRQLGMVELILPYFEELEKKGLIENGKNEALRQWDEVDAVISKQEKNLDAYIQPLIAVISKETFPNGSANDRLIDKIGDETKAALSTFIKTMLPDEAITWSHYFDVEKLLVATYKAYHMQFDTFQDWNQRDLFCISVIGFLQSLQNTELAKVFCEGFYYVAVEKRPIGDRAAALRLADKKSSFYRPYRDLDYGLGADWLIGLIISNPTRRGYNRDYPHVLVNYIVENEMRLTSLKQSLSHDIALDVSLTNKVGT